MKKYTLLIVLVLILGILLCTEVIIYLFRSSNSAGSSSMSQNTFPEAEQRAASPTVINQAFLSQSKEIPNIQLQGAIVAMPYALENWGNGNMGGQALLKYDPATGWKVISLGGGEWDAPSLVQEGVPQNLAEQLVADNH